MSGRQEIRAAKVVSYDDARRLDGTASDNLIEASAAEPTGAVPAYRDADGVWQYVPPSQVEFMGQRGEDVITVYVEA